MAKTKNKRRSEHAIKDARIVRPTVRSLPYLSVFVASIASAQTVVPKNDKTSDNTLPAVTVTAERRETKLQETPISVGVIGGDTLTKNSHPQPRDMNGAVAGIVAPGGWQNGSSGSYYIRGIGTSSPTYAAAVATYVDDVYIARQIGSGLFMDMPDVQRIEVLRGPQGTLYGENSSAGAIKIVSLDPTENVAWIQGTGGSERGFGTKGYISRVLVPDVLFGSIAFNRYKNQGYTYNETLHKYVDATNVSQFRAKLRFTPTSDFEAVLAVDGTHDGSDQVSPVALNLPGSSPSRTYDNADPGISRNIGGISLKLSKKLDDHLTLRSITAYRQFKDTHYPTLLDGLSTDTFGFVLNQDQHQVTQEFQLLGDYGRFKFTTGIIGLREGVTADRPSYTSGVYQGIHSTINNTSVAAYLQGSYQVTQRLGLTAGIRANRDWQIYNNYGFTSNQYGSHLATTFATGDLTQDVNSVTPKIGLDYKWSPYLFSYVSVTKGEKAGGYNPVAATLAIAKVAVNPEHVTTYEFGTKASAFGDRLQANWSVFYNDFKNYQAAVANAIVNGQAINGSVTVNAGKVHTYGSELELTARPIRRLLLSTWATVLQGTFQEFSNPTGAANTNYVGNQVPYVSHLVAGARATYNLPSFGLPGSAEIDGTIRYLGPYYQDIANKLRTPAQVLLDLGTSYTSANGQWTVALRVSNVLNHRYQLANYYTPSIGLNSAFYNPPRTFEASLRYDF